ncbi:MAG: DUF1761 domain-containing protein [Chloroflexi bacterium]|nr:DUF1761 domain-containing protein [Chloroflexota bacterium]
MDSIDLGSLNYVAIVVGVVINQLTGMAWYTVFSRYWMAETGMTQEDMEAMRGTPRQWYPYVIAVSAGVVFVVALAVLIQGLGAEGAAEGLAVGLLAAVAFIMTTNAMNYAFEGKSLLLYGINNGYHLLAFAVIGAVLGAWQ